MNIVTTAANIQPGDILYRVQPLPGSAVFTTPVDARVLAVEPITSAPGNYLHIALEPGATATAAAVNLQADRQVTVIRDDEPTVWVHVYDDEPCDDLTAEQQVDRVCGHGQQVTEVYVDAPEAPVDPDTLFLTRAAKDFLQVVRYSDSAPALTVAMNLWTSLTGLATGDAIAYAERLAEAGEALEVTAHVRPF